MNRYRRNIKVVLDVVLWSLMLPVAYMLRLEGDTTAYASQIGTMVLIMLPVKVLVLYFFRLHYHSWHKFGVRDLFVIAQAVAVSAAILFLAGGFLLPWVDVAVFLPLSIPFLEATLSLIALGGMRLAARMRSEQAARKDKNFPHKKTVRMLIVGAGEAGTMLAREMLRHPESAMIPIGFLDDEPRKQKEIYTGVPVLGRLEELEKVTYRHHIEKVLIAMPTAPGQVIRKVVEEAQRVGIPYQIMPGIYELLSGKITISQLRDVDVQDLLRREPVKLDLEPISDYLTNRTILVTGAGGSIGGEIVRQITHFEPDRILLLGRGENSIYEIEQECRQIYPNLAFIPVITDVKDRRALTNLFRKYRPEVVFHTAAHKHVPLMEQNPDQAILNNVVGTRNMVDLALEYGVKRFVNISSDKSVNPTSIMGASKRVAEYIVEWASCQADKEQEFVSVRFGNVLGSRGSVVPLFKDQIRKGGPITITHPDMTRYFMTIPEASQLVLQAGGLGGNGSVYVLDMSEPVKIQDLARDLIKLSGYKLGKDIDIIYTGIRPGEKMFEELLTAEEGTNATRHAKIFKAKTTGLPGEAFELLLNRLVDAAKANDDAAIRRQLEAIIPSCAFKPAAEPKTEVQPLQ